MESGNVKAVLSNPGFSDEARRGRGAIISGTEEDNAPPVPGAAWHSMIEVREKECFAFEVVGQQLNRFVNYMLPMLLEIAAVSCHAHVLQQLGASLSSECLRVAHHDLMSHPPKFLLVSSSSGSSSIPFATASMSEPLLPAPENDPRWNSWPCSGKHTPGRYRNNQYATWRTCSRCALRLEYTPKQGYKGIYRQAGPSNTVLATAIGEIRMEMEASEVTEKHVNDKCMEVAGRLRQQGYNVTTREPIERVKGSEPKASAMKKSPISKAKGNDARESEEAEKEVSPVNLSNEKIHQSLYEISQLEQRMQAQRDKLMEEVGLRGLMEEDGENGHYEDTPVGSAGVHNPHKHYEDTPVETTGYEAMFFELEEFQKFEKDTTKLDSKVRNHERALRGDFVIEMPAKLRACCSEISYLKDAASEQGMTVYDFKIHGCAFGMRCGGLPVMKEWRVMTTSEAVKIGLERRCPGHPEHVEDHGGCAQCSDPRWFPKAMEKRVVDDSQSKHGVRTLAADVFALARQKIPLEPPTGKKLEEIKQMVLRLHRSSGHSSFVRIAKLLERRGAPSWAIELTKSMGPPLLWEICGTDVFEYAFKTETGQVKKLKGCIWVDRASRYCVVSGLKIYEDAWEPTTADITRVFLRDWMMTSPAPRWLIADSALYYTSEEMRDFCGRSGIGLLISPPEAHWLMSHEEQLIGRLKATVDRMIKEDPDLSVISMFHYACHACNSTIQHQSGYSPFQWVRGAVPSDMVPEGANPKKAFEETLKFREQAAIAYRRAQAADQMSKLGNTTSRPPQVFEPGTLAMIWRERRANGRGGWQGLVRILLRETAAITNGAAVCRMPVTLVKNIPVKEEDLHGQLSVHMRIQLDACWIVGLVRLVFAWLPVTPPPLCNIALARMKLRLNLEILRPTATASASGDKAQNEASVEHRDPPESSRGRYRLPHVDAGGSKFMYDKRTEVMIPVEASDAETSVVADSTDSEMVPDVPTRSPEGQGRKDRKRKEPAAPDDMTGYMFEIDMADKDWQQLAGKPRRGPVQRDFQRDPECCGEKPSHAREADVGLVAGYENEVGAHGEVRRAS
ncbi:unnamed protein product [Symbiodinium sp. CCMP2592]|nr:unnamed protein product [Symbiodinium sp. CCMP2592]